MPTKQELDDLDKVCDWEWTTVNGMKGYEIRGRGAYASASIFLPGVAGYGYGTSLFDAGLSGQYWSSVPASDGNYYAWCLTISSSGHGTHDGNDRSLGRSVRPVQGFTK